MEADETLISRSGLNSIPLGSQQSENPSSTESDVSENSSVVFVPPKHGKITYHVGRSREVKNKWRLFGLTQDTNLILGASNINRIPEEVLPENWIAHSFSGARLSHFINILSTYDGPSPKLIILHIGLNDRGNMQSTNSQNLGRVFTLCRDKFKDSVVVFAKLNYSRHLKDTEREILEHMNSVFSSKQELKVIEKIPGEKFSVDNSDGEYIHWTAATARTLVNHWLNSVKGLL